MGKTERLNPLNDYLFLKAMGEKGAEEQCLGFLNSVFESKSLRPAKLIKILENKTFTADIIGEKTSILDVRVETDTGEMINIEVQLRDLKNMEKRTLLHWGREYVKSISMGEDYKNLSKEMFPLEVKLFQNYLIMNVQNCFHLF